MFNDIYDEFGDELCSSKAAAKVAWEDLDDDEKEKVMNTLVNEGIYEEELEQE